MTKALLDYLGEMHTTSLIAWLFAVSIVAFLLPVAVFWDFIRGQQRRAWMHRILSQTSVRCEAGHKISVLGHWRCRCGMTFTGSAFAPCPHCSSTEHAIRCVCGRQVVSPTSPLFEEGP